MDIWDLTLLLKYYEQKENNDCLQFKELVKKAVMLFLILGARRKQALFTLSVDNIVFKENKVILLPNKNMKHTKGNRPLERLIYHHYSDSEKLCIVKCLQSYIEIRKTLVTRDIRDLIISYCKPNKPVSSETISRWIKDEISKAGVDTSVFEPHSCRSASSYKARDAGISVSEILKREVEKVYILSKRFTPGI